MTAPATIARNADLESLVAILRGQQPRKYDFVTPVSTISSYLGDLVIEGAEKQLGEDGVTDVSGYYKPTAICDGGLAEKFGIPPGYLTMLRHEDPDLYDANVNGRARHAKFEGKRFLVRVLRNEGSDTGGVARAFLSDYYKPIDNLDVLMTVLEGVAAAGVEVQIHGCDLSDRRMYVQIHSEAVRVAAPTLLKGYRSPFTGQEGKDLPLVFAGFTVSNSEVGHGAFSIVPTVRIQVCRNGAQISKEAIRAQHLGGQLPDGDITWSDTTQQKNLDLIKAKTADAVRAFLSEEWLQRQIDKMEAQAGVQIAKPEETIQVVADKLRYSEAQQNDILAMFIKGGQLTAGGVMQAVTASAQNQRDADLAMDMEGDAMRALELAVTHAG